MHFSEARTQEDYYLILPSNTYGCFWLVGAVTITARATMQVAAHVDICHDDGSAAEHNVWFPFDLGFARNLVAGILSSVNCEPTHLQPAIKARSTGRDLLKQCFEMELYTLVKSQGNLLSRCIRILLICAQPQLDATTCCFQLCTTANIALVDYISKPRECRKMFK